MVILLFLQQLATFGNKFIKKSQRTDGYRNSCLWKAANLEIFILSTISEELKLIRNYSANHQDF